MRIIRLTDSLVITTNKDTHTINKFHPLFSRIEQVTDNEEEFYKVLNTKYDVIYEAYDQNNDLIVTELSNTGLKTLYPTIPDHSSVPNLDTEEAAKLGVFIDYNELIDYYPEYFI